MTVATELDRVPWTLTAALGVVVVESAIEAGFVLGRDGLGVGAKVLLVMAFVAKVAFAGLARRRSAGGALGLLTFEAVGILVALAAPWAVALRLGLVACVVVVFALVISSLDAFPTPDLPTP